MPFINTQCTSCGANLRVDNTKTIWTCDYCHNTIYNNCNNTNNDFEIIAGELRKYKGMSVNAVIPDCVVRIGRGAFQNYPALKRKKLRVCAYCGGEFSVKFPSMKKICKNCKKPKNY